ncbi:DUF4340 domain-containing protein [Desulfolithobacter sp.]
MKRPITLLAAVAILQVFLIAVTWMSDAGLREQITRTALLDFDPGQIDQITLTDGTDMVVLEKKEGVWQTGDGFPADRTKVGNLLDRLAGLKTGMPVATSREALTRFRVDADDFERHLTLAANDKTVAELFVGTGAGARRSHVRAGDSEVVHAVALGSYDLPVSPESWYDKTILELDPDTITALRLGEIALTRSKNDDDQMSAWTLSPADDTRKINQDAVNQAVTRIGALRLATILGRKQKAAYGLDAPVLEITVTTPDLERTYRFGRITDSDDYALSVSDRDEFFKIASYDATPILDALKEEKLFTADTTTPEPPADEQGEAQPDAAERGERDPGTP